MAIAARHEGSAFFPLDCVFSIFFSFNFNLILILFKYLV